MQHLFGLNAFERFFHRVANLQMDKNDFRRFDDFLNAKLYDLAVRAVATAKANGRDVVEPQDLPVTAGLQQCVQAFRGLGEDASLDALLEELTRRPPLGATLSVETQALLPELAGGIGVALARSFRILDETLKTPTGGHWDRATRIFDLLL